jgi:hypothetical protein
MLSAASAGGWRQCLSPLLGENVSGVWYRRNLCQWRSGSAANSNGWPVQWRAMKMWPGGVAVTGVAYNLSLTINVMQ